MTRRSKIRAHWSNLVGFGVGIAVIATITVVSIWLTTRATGTIDVCQSDTGDEHAIMLTVSENYGRNHSTSTRSLFPINLLTGKTGKYFATGKVSQCLGGLGANVLLSTSADGIHVRDPASGAIVASEEALLGDLAHSVRAYKYNRASHRIEVTTKFNDVVTIDLLTRQRLSIEIASTPPPPTRIASLSPLLFPSEHDRLAGIARGSSETLACNGSRCKLATHAMNAYGNTIGVDPAIVPISAADELLVAELVRFLPDEQAVLVTSLARLDESTRQLVLVGLDGKVRWTVPIRQKILDGYEVGDALIVGNFSLPNDYVPRDSRFYSNHDVDGWIIGKADGQIRAVIHIPERTTIAQDLADVVVATGNMVVFAAHGEAVALPLSGGAPVWKKRF